MCSLSSSFHYLSGFSVALISVVCFPANTLYDGDKESEGEDDCLSPEDTRKVRTISCFFHRLGFVIVV